MTHPDIQFFPRNGTWIRPQGASETEMIVRFPGTDSAQVQTFRGTGIPAQIDMQVASGYVVVVTQIQESAPARPCPACGEEILVVQASRRGGQLEAFDPEPSLDGGEHNTLLSEDRAFIVHPAAKTGNLRGRVELHRPHRYTCRAQMRIPGDRPLPAIGGYSQAAAGWPGGRA